MVNALCVHGIGHQEEPESIRWQEYWKAAIQQGIRDSNPNLDFQFDFLAYDPLFEPILLNLTARDVASAVFKLLGGAVTADLSELFNRPRGIHVNFSERARWTAGMVVAWVENDDLRAATGRLSMTGSTRFGRTSSAHSLGSLICYDAFRRREEAVAGKMLITFGSRINNRFIKGGAFGGRIDPFPGAELLVPPVQPPRSRVHRTIQLDASNFRQVFTEFGSFVPWVSNHDAALPDQPVSNSAYLSRQTRTRSGPRFRHGGG